MDDKSGKSFIVKGYSYDKKNLQNFQYDMLQLRHET
jgi:hypothetical protein